MPKMLKQVKIVRLLCISSIIINLVFYNFILKYNLFDAIFFASCICICIFDAIFFASCICICIFDAKKTASCIWFCICIKDADADAWCRKYCIQNSDPGKKNGCFHAFSRATETRFNAFSRIENGQKNGPFFRVKTRFNFFNLIWNLKLFKIKRNF